MGSSTPKQVKQPDPVNPGTSIALDSLFSTPNMSGPLGRQERGHYDSQGNWTALGDADYAAAMAGLQDPAHPNFASLIPLLSSETRLTEDPALKAMREHSWAQTATKQGIGDQYLNQFNGQAPTSGLVPLLKNVTAPGPYTYHPYTGKGP